MSGRPRLPVRPGAILAVLLVALTWLALGAAAPKPAGADGDPASDVLLGTDVFYPYSPPVAPATAHTLDAVTATARRLRAPVKVALIASGTDLGVVPSLFGRPQQYADFLGQEISFIGPERLLVVMPAGYGTHGLDPAARSAVAALPRPAGASSTALATAAITAVERIAAAYGHPLPVAGSSAKASSSSSSPVLPIAIVVAVVLALALVAGTLRRRSRTQS